MELHVQLDLSQGYFFFFKYLILFHMGGDSLPW